MAVEYINKILWIVATILILTNSIYYSITLKFPQFRLIQIFKSIKKTSTKTQISPFDTLIMALSSKIGVGSLAGMSIAISYGGLGSIFWIWICALFLSILTYLENSLAIIYKEQDGSLNKSGPSYYIKKGLNKKFLSIVYSILIIITYIFLFSSIQTNTITTLSHQMYGFNKLLVSTIIVLLTTIIIIKGIKTISTICNKVFPFMMMIFILTGIIIITINLHQIPFLLQSILSEAFNTQSLTGGLIYTIIIALQKSIFASEAGAGTSAIISGTTENTDYKLQGNIGIIQTYFINFIVLTIIGIIIGLTDFNTIKVINGIELTQYAFHYHLGNFGETILFLILFLFSFSTIITIYYYGESSLKFLTTNKKSIAILKLLTLSALFTGGIINASIIWSFIDIFLALLTIINMYAIYKLKNTIVSKLKN